MLERYGVENPFQMESVKAASLARHEENKIEIQAKREAVMLERHGVTNPFNISSVRKDTIAAVKQYQSSEKATAHRAALADSRRIVFTSADVAGLPANGQIVAAARGCSPSHANKELRALGIAPQYSITAPEQKIKDILDRLGAAYTHRDRTVLGGKRELDFYLQQHNLGIEVNGMYWHSVSGVDHSLKRKEAANLGIHLLQFWDSQILNKPRIVESVIRTRIGLLDRRLFGRRLNEVRVCAARDTAQFFAENHLMGTAPAKYHLGLYDATDGLVCAMSLSPPRFGRKLKKNELEIVRFATKLNYSVIGGFTKLVAHVEKALNPDRLVSFVDRMTFSGSSLLAAGFEQQGEAVGYAYYSTETGAVVSRYKAQKHKLPALLGAKYNAQLTETQNMLSAGYKKLFDAGQTKFVKTYSTKKKEDRTT